MKVMIVTTLYPPDITGGAEITIKTIAEALVVDKVDVSVLVTKGEPGLSMEEINGVRVWRAGIRNIYWHNDKQSHPNYQKAVWHMLDVYNPSMAKYAETVFATEQPDVIQVHVTTGLTSSILRWATKKNVPTIQVLHGYYLLCINGNTFAGGNNCVSQCTKCKVARAPHKIYTNKFSAVVGCSNAVLNRHKAFGFFEGIKSHNVIYNSRDPKMLGSRAPAVFDDRAEVERETGTQSAEHVSRPGGLVKFGFMGALAGTKGLELLLAAFIGSSPPNTQLQIAGTGDERYVQSLRDNFKHDRVVFIGKSDPASFFGNVDVAVVPSLWEDPLPGVTFEALAFGCPVIGATRGGIQEMIQVGVNGLIFDPDKPAELANAIVTLATDSELRLKMSKNASPSVRNFFSISRISNDYRTLYDRLITDRAAAA